LAFLIGHIYLATTGPTPWSLVRAMITASPEDENVTGASRLSAAAATPENESELLG
jgi:hypothetical protein